MIRKPWPIIIVSFLFLLFPLFNLGVTYFLVALPISFYDFLNSLVFNSHNRLLFLTLTIPSLLAAFAIYKVKKWSYPLFLISMLWIFLYEVIVNFSHLNIWDFVFVICLPMTINISFISFLLLPNLRAPYYNSRLRWWETKPRYMYSSDLEIKLGDLLFTGQMQNISEGGLFATFSNSIEPQSVVLVKFIVLNIPIEIKAKIVYRKNDGSSYGLQFFEVTRSQKIILKKMTTKLVENRFEESRPTPPWFEDFKNWFLTLIKTGKGVIPEAPNDKK